MTPLWLQNLLWRLAEWRDRDRGQPDLLPRLRRVWGGRA
jgi:hypothetical protein